MCSHYFVKRMENYQGDLTDIIRATAATPPAETPTSTAAVAQWQFPTNPVDYPACPVDDFGNPFTPLRDPMLHAASPTLAAGFFHHSDMIKGGADQSGGFVGNSNLDDEMKRPPNIFSRMLQISPTENIPLSPCDSPAAAVGERGVKGGGGPPILVPNDHHRTFISPSNSKSCLVESSLQISSPRNTGIRRRKSQAKKVVCIPAPAPAGSRPSGEVVPSDLWAWRKYGQKPIKGSPYPRGYYRCSSSKGCSARKQVERSRTDPNMLVITYTSEHNHPWPTQRNALAGSTRSQPSKTAAKTSPPKSTNPNEPTTDNAAPAPSSAAVKEEADQEFDNHRFEPAGDDEGFPYKPILPDSNPSGEESFFADLGEIEADSLDLLFTQGFDGRDSKGLDPFGFYDWGGSGSGGPTASNGGAAASHGESERGS